MDYFKRRKTSQGIVGKGHLRIVHDRKELRPIVLVVTNERSESSLQVLVVYFGLAICLWMISSGQLSLSLEDLAKRSPEPGDELRSSVRSDGKGSAKVSVYMVNVRVAATARGPP